MIQLFGTGEQRIFYRAALFQTGLTVTAYLWSPTLEKSALQTLTEIEEGLYYLDYNFTSLGGWPIILMEGETKTVFETIRIEAGVVDIAAVADAVWDEAHSAHDSAGSFGEVVRRLVSKAMGSIIDGSIFDLVLNKNSNQTFNAATDSLEAIRDAGDATWRTAGKVQVQSSAVLDNLWEFYAHDTIEQPVTGLGNITGYTAVWVAVKENRSDEDSAALLLISSDVGLEVLNGEAGTPGEGSVTVDSAIDGNITIRIEAVAAAELAAANGLVWAIKWKDAEGDVHTLLDGIANIRAGVVRAIS